VDARDKRDKRGHDDSTKSHPALARKMVDLADQIADRERAHKRAVFAVFALAAEIGAQANAGRRGKIEFVNLAANSASQPQLLADRDQMQLVTRGLEAAVDAPSRRRTGENQFAHVVRHPPAERASIAVEG